ncbi:hypothetical protein JCM24511_09074 [Saitozyma sp. JCM 24511]|nr:hypothetical protein JCM24511_09074 [Saitozyma sp. JCM 24511]
MSSSVESAADPLKVSLVLRSFRNEQIDRRTTPVTDLSIMTSPKGFRWRGKEFTVELGKLDDLERPGDRIHRFSQTVGADDLWEPVCTISGSSCTVDLSERTKVCFVQAFSSTVSVPPSVKKCVVTGSSSTITLKGDRNVIVVGGSSNTVTAKSGTVIDLPKGMIPMMDGGSLVVTQEGEVFDGTQVFAQGFGSTINVLGEDSLVFTTGAFGTSVSRSLGSSAVGPGAFYNVGLTNNLRAGFTGEIWEPEGSSKHKRALTLGLAGALVAHMQRDPSVAPEEGSSWAQEATDMLSTQQPTASDEFQQLLSVTRYSEGSDVAVADFDGIRYKGDVTVEWTVHVPNFEVAEKPSTEDPDQPPVLDQAETDGSMIAEQDGPSIQLPLRQAYVEDRSDTESDYQVVGTPESD